MNPATRPSTPYDARWKILAVISVGFVAMTLNWFDIAPAFPAIGTDFHTGISSTAFLISLFLLGYGIAHIPGGMLATRIGMKRTLVIGLLLEGLAGLASGLCQNYLELATVRVVAGVGASIFIAVAFGAVSVWFEHRETTLALGISGGAAFSVGAAIGLYLWSYLIAAIGWRGALAVAGAFAVLVALAVALTFDTPAHIRTLGGVAVTLAALRESLANRQLWIYGVALLGGYGAYFTVSQLLAGYAVSARALPTAWASLLSAVVGLAGIPGSIIGGALADRWQTTRTIVIVPLLLMAVSLALIPVVPLSLLWVLAVLLGALDIFSFAAWAAVPARVAKVRHENIGTAVGLMLTIAAVGGFVVPAVFGQIVPHSGYAVGWLFLGIVTAATALVGLAGRNSPGSHQSGRGGDVLDVEPELGGVGVGIDRGDRLG
jgi:ACS family D-galactonate transporter-like MFS transporter